LRIYSGVGLIEAVEKELTELLPSFDEGGRN